MNKKALITGVSGQDGYYLAELLSTKGYSIFGISRDSKINSQNITYLAGDITDQKFIEELIAKEKFDEIYNLASIATVASPWEDPLLVANVVGIAPIFILEAVRKSSPATRVFQASSAEIFGDAKEFPQNEETLANPKTPYAVAKLFAQNMAKQYREVQNIFVCAGILFNHESPLRAESFVTRKITRTLAKIAHGENIVLELGNLNAKRDWGYAGDYVEAMWMMLQADKPDDYVVASGEICSVKDFVNYAAKALEIKLNWQGENENEQAVDDKGKIIIKVNPEFYRPLDIATRQGDISKICTKLGWKPKTNLEKLVEIMCEADKALLGNFQ